MLPNERDFLINRICSGYIDLNGKMYKHPSKKRKYQADLVYQKALTSGFTSEDAIDLLIEQGRWSKKLDKEISDDIPKVIEQLKIEIFQAYKVDRSLLPSIRDKLSRVKDHLLSLISIKRCYDEYTVEYLAEKEKTLYLIAKCAKTDCPDKYIHSFYESQISDEKYRELARCPEWTQKWIAFKRGAKIFSDNLTIEQEILIKWSSLYENILEQQDCPDDEIIEDDDALDGWMIWKKRENLRNKGQDEVENLVKDKGAQEVFIPVDKKHPVFEAQQEHWKEAKRIASLNSPETAKRKKERLDKVVKLGEVPEYQMVKGRLVAAFDDDKVKLALARNGIKID